MRHKFQPLHFSEKDRQGKREGEMGRGRNGEKVEEEGEAKVGGQGRVDGVVQGERTVSQVEQRQCK